MLTTPHTAERLATFLAKQIEPDNAEAVLRALTPFDGTLITTRLLDKLPGGRIEWRLTREMGWTVLKNRAQVQTKGDSRDALDFRLARSEASVPLDVTWFEHENGQYFAARRARNAQRTAAMHDPALLFQFAFVLNEILDLNHKLAVAKTTFEGFVAPGKPFAPDHYEWERLCGLREDKR